MDLRETIYLYKAICIYYLEQVIDVLFYKLLELCIEN